MPSGGDSSGSLLPLLVMMCQPIQSQPAPEDKHAHDDYQHEQSQFLVAASQSLSQCLETRDVPGQLEDPGGVAKVRSLDGLGLDPGGVAKVTSLDGAAQHLRILIIRNIWAILLI